VTGICPHCGYNLTQDSPIYRDGWVLYPTVAIYKEKVLALSQQEAGMLYALAKAAPLELTSEVIANRISRGECDPRVRVGMAARRIREKLGSLTPFYARGGAPGGYCWHDPSLPEDAGDWRVREKLSEGTVRLMRASYAAGLSYDEIAFALGVTYHRVYTAVTRRTFTKVT